MQKLPFQIRKLDLSKSNPELPSILSQLSARFQGISNFKLTPQFLQWSFKKTNFYPQWHMGFYIGQNLLGALIAVPFSVRMKHSKDQKEAQAKKGAKVISFCLNQSIIQSVPRLFAMMINQVKNKFLEKGRGTVYYWHESKVGPTVAVLRQFKRVINIKKINNILGVPVQSMTQLLYKVKEDLNTKDLKAMSKKDVNKVFIALEQANKNKTMSLKITQEEVRQIFLPRESLVVTYLAYSDKSLAHFFSFFRGTASLNGKDIEVAKLIAFISETPGQLLEDVLMICKQQGVDQVFCEQNLIGKELLQKKMFEETGWRRHVHVLGNREEWQNSEVGVTL